ncbi:phage tail baseplate protein, partial [Sphingorhabdus sp.]
MATLILTTVGSFFGGPIGGALGGYVGRQIDSAIFGGPKPREGARLNELTVQTSSYGTQIPGVLGKMRMAGTVIWASDLIEQKVKSGGGKNRPSTVQYSYSVNLAVAISSRPVKRIGRIWADGNLVRGQDGIFKVDTEFRFYPGSEFQAVDPLIASAENVAKCPAFRGLSYVVFEGLQLADFGNRVPSFSFEVIERDAPVSVSDICNSASGGLISGTSAETVSGYALQGDSARASIKPVLKLAPVAVLPVDDGMVVRDWAAPMSSHSLSDVAEAQGDARPSLDRSFPGAEAEIPAFGLRYYDVSRDFQAGLQVSARSGVGRKPHAFEFPGALDAQAALRLADWQLLNIPRQSFETVGMFAIGPESLAVGDKAMLPGDQRSWHIAEVEMSGLALRVTLRSAFVDSGPDAALADPGRNLVGSDLPIGETVLVAMDLPALAGNNAEKPIVAIAAAGTEAGWRRAAISLIDGDNRIELGQTAPAAIIGELLEILPPHPNHLLDTQNQLRVRLLHEAMELPAGSGHPVSPTAPAVWIGDEIVRYGFAERISATDYRLTNLLRGVSGTDFSPNVHQIGAPLVLLDSDTLHFVEGHPLIVGQDITFEAMGLADVLPETTELLLNGNALRPLSPVHSSFDVNDAGDGLLSWIRRTRRDNGWQDSVDIPIGEDVLSFEILCYSSGLLRSAWTTDVEHLVIPAAELTALAGGLSGVLDFEFRQIGTHSKSGPALL